MSNSRNYRKECEALLTQIKSNPQHNADGWQFSVYAPERIDYVAITYTDFEKTGHYGEYYAFNSDTRRTWKELADYMRAYLLGFYRGKEAQKSQNDAIHVCIEIKSPNNVSGNCKRLYVLYDVDGCRTNVFETRPSAFIVSDTLRLSSAEFKEYARIAKSQESKGTR